MLSRLLATAVGRGSGARPPSLLAGSRARFSMMGRTAAFLRPSSVDARGLFRIRRPCSQKQVPQLMLPSALWGSRALSVPLSRPLLGRQWAIQEEGGASVTTSGSSTSSGSRKSQAGGRRGVRRKVTKPEGAGPVVVFGPHRALPLEAFEGQPVLVREELVALATELAAHDDLYYNRDKPLISDAEYDALALRLAALEDRRAARKHPFFLCVWEYGYESIAPKGAPTTQPHVMTPNTQASRGCAGSARAGGLPLPERPRGRASPRGLNRSIIGDRARGTGRRALRPGGARLADAVPGQRVLA